MASNLNFHDRGDLRMARSGRNISFWHLIAGIIMAALGVYIWFNPAVTLLALALYLGVAFLIVGAGYFAASFSYSSGWYMFVGLLDMLVGVIFIANLGVTAVSLPIIFALWCLAVGVIQVVAAFQFRNSGLAYGWTMTAGILGLLFSFLILAYPVVGTITITALMGAYVLLYGIVEIVEYTTQKRMIFSRI